MDVIEQWTGQAACVLQAAMRMTNEGFAEHLGVGVRTVAGWHAGPGLVPRPEMQRILDTAYERASDSVQRRFGLLSRPPASTAEAQALRVAIAVVTRGSEVLLVCRRGSDALRWQFPAGVVKPGASAEAVTVQETHAETGVHCAVRQHLGSRVHPVTGVVCEYYLCDWLAGEPSNLDALENLDVAWAAVSSLGRFIPVENIYPPITAALKECA